MVRDVVMREDLEKVIGATYPLMSEAYANEYVELLISHFGYETWMIDNQLTRNERELFYNLQDEGLLLSRRETVTIKPSVQIKKRGSKKFVTRYDSSDWTIAYWKYNLILMDAILSGGGEEREPARESNEYTIYDDIPDDNWIR